MKTSLLDNLSAVYDLHDNATLMSKLSDVLVRQLGLNCTCSVSQDCLLADIGDLVPYDLIPDCYGFIFRLLPSDTIMGASTLAVWEVVLKCTVYVIAMLLTIVGNVWVLVTIVMSRSMHIPTYYFLANLAASDLLVGTFCMPLHLARHISLDWPFGRHMCKIYQASQILAVTSNVLFLSLIASDRFFAIVLSRHIKPQMSGSVTCVMIVVSWLTAIAFASPLLTVTEMQSITFQDRTVTWCAEQWPRYLAAIHDSTCTFTSPQRLGYYITHVVFLFFVPLSVMFVLYFLIMLKLWRKCSSTTSNTGSFRRNRIRAKVVRTLVCILLVFTICWTPQQVSVFYFAVSQTNTAADSQMSESFWYVTMMLAYLHSAANPIIYAALHSNFRKTSHQLCQRLFKRATCL